MNAFFRKFANQAADVLGTGWAFMFAIGILLVWAVTGPIFKFSDTWQLIINTATNLITFLMVFLIQNTQNRDSKATQVKLDELIRALRGARNNLVNIEDLSDDDLDALRAQFQRIGERYAHADPEVQEAVGKVDGILDVVDDNSDTDPGDQEGKSAGAQPGG